MVKTQVLHERWSSFYGLNINVSEDTMTDKRLAVMKMVPEYSGEGSVSEWLDKLQAVCGLSKVTDEEDVVYVMVLRLTGGAYTLYQQMPADKKRKRSEIEKVLLAAYEVNAFVAFEQFKEKRLEPGESVDEYLATLRKLVRLIDGVSDKALLCAFVSGLPDHVRELVRSGANVNGMGIDEALTRARAALKDEVRGRCGAMTNGPRHRPIKSESRPSERPRGERRCYHCDGLGHVRSRCPRIECYKCHKKGHYSTTCPENEARE